MLHGDEVWCQLFSEPAAGSDLAGSADARAPASDDGSWTLNGQKVWTTNAQFASYGLLLARTDPDVPKHKGLTMFIVPMDAEGVTVRGLRQISGEAEFNEVFFDDVRARRRTPSSARVDNGWGIGADDADVRAPDDRPRARGLRLPRRPLRATRSRTTRPPAATPRCATGSASSPPSCSAIRFTGYRSLTALSARPDPRPGGRPGEGHDRQRGDQGRRPDRRRARARGARRRQRVGLHDLVPARPEVRRRHRGDPAQHDRRARARAAARAAPGQGHPVQRAARQGEGRGGDRDELRPCPTSRSSCARPRAARSRASRPSRPPARRSRTPARCPTCGRRPSRPAGPGC